MRDRQNIRGILLTTAAVLLFAGCTEEDIRTAGGNDGKMRVSFTVPMVAEEVPTRAALAENTTVRVVAYVAGGGMTYAAQQAYYMNGGKLKPCTVNADGSFKAVDNAGELALVPDKYDFYAITPALPLNGDQKTVNVPNGIDYASSVTSNITVNTDLTQALAQLSRKCARIKLEIKKADDNAEMTALEVNRSGNGVTVSALPAMASNVMLNSDIAAAKGEAILKISALSFSRNGTTSTATTYLLPRLGTDRMKIDYDLTYTISEEPESKTVSGTMGNTVLEKGKSYTFTLTMRKTGASITVTEWSESNQEVTTGQELDYTDNGKPWFLIASKDAINPVDGSATMNWYIANGITDVTHNPTGARACPDGWKVPNVEEMALLYAFKNATPNHQYKTDATNYYWTPLFSAKDTALVYRIVDGHLLFSKDYGSKTSNNSLRCIRETAIGVVKYPYINSDGKTIVVRDNAGGVNTGAIHDNWSTTPLHNEQQTSNALSRQFEIAKEDCNSTNAPNVANSNNKYTYTNASSACTAYSEAGSAAGVWRVPTLRELMSILYMYQKGKLSGVTAPATTLDYWSATYQRADYNAWRLNFANGGILNIIVSTSPYATTYYVRCVRDVQ